MKLSSYFNQLEEPIDDTEDQFIFSEHLEIETKE